MRGREGERTRKRDTTEDEESTPGGGWSMGVKRPAEIVEQRESEKRRGFGGDVKGRVQ